MPKVSYIVSAYNRPAMLKCCLASLSVQTDRDFEVIVADNSTDFDTARAQSEIVADFRDPRFRHIDTDCVKTCAGWDCYHSAEYAAALSTGNWLCFPSDDSYYVPLFQEAMMAAASEHEWDLVYCDWLCDRRGHVPDVGPGSYHCVSADACMSKIDKTGFMVRRGWFNGFPGKKMLDPGPAPCDGMLIDGLVGRGIKHGKVKEILMVHN